MRPRSGVSGVLESKSETATGRKPTEVGASDEVRLIPHRG